MERNLKQSGLEQKSLRSLPLLIYRLPHSSTHKATSMRSRDSLFSNPQLPQIRASRLARQVNGVVAAKKSPPRRTQPIGIEARDIGRGAVLITKSRAK